MKQRIKNIFIIALIILAAFLLQNFISLYSANTVVTPNLLLIVTCIFGLMCGRNYGITVGFFCGLLVDVMYGEVIGFVALIYMYCGFFSGMFKRMFYSEQVLMPMALIFVNDFVYNAAYYLFRFLLRNKLDFSYYFVKLIFPEMIITTVITLFVYKLFFLLNEKVISKDKGSALSFD